MGMSFVRKFARRVIDTIPIVNRAFLASTVYRRISESEARTYFATHDGWQSKSCARRQEKAYEPLLSDLRAGHPRVDFTVAAEAVRATGLATPSLLEVGCGNGYYREVFERLTPGLRYTGVDYSPAMVERARLRYPGVEFGVGDATDLAYSDKSFDIVFNGVSLMHILDYPRAIAEAKRVARSYLILHSVPVFDSYETVYLRKCAYGAPVVEMVFDRQTLERQMEEAGLRIFKVWPSISYDVVGMVGIHSRCVTYLAGV